MSLPPTMRSHRHAQRALLLVLSSSLLMGASCNSRREETPAEAPSVAASPAGGGPAIESLPEVELPDFIEPERRDWLALVNAQLSPCGEPISVARCVHEKRNCSKCVPAARYLARLVGEGFDKAQIEEMYRLRYTPAGKFDFSLQGAPVRGAPMAPHTIVVFSDFECPFCSAAHPALDRLVEEANGKLRLVFKHYPLDGHPRARPAARAAIAASKQGKFWEMHDLLFSRQNALEPADLEAYAKELGLNLETFKKDLASEDVDRRIDADRAEGKKAGVQGTPTIFINGRRFDESPRNLAAYVQEELES